MANSEKKKNNDDGIGWLTRPFYNIMLLSLAVLYLMKEHENNYNDIFHILIFISFGIIVIANVWNVIDFFRRSKNPKEENKIEVEEE